MKNSRFLTLMGGIFLALLAAVCYWQAPRHVMTTIEIDRSMSVIEQNLVMPADEKVIFVKRIRTWAEADDGKPVYMLNLLRYHKALQAIAGATALKGTPVEVNAAYEAATTALVLGNGVYPVAAGQTNGVAGLFPSPDNKGNLLGYDPASDNWGRVILVRYPSRKACMELLSHPDFASLMPMKMAASDVFLVPVDVTTALPDLRLLAGTLLLIAFLVIGWWRSYTSVNRSAPGSSMEVITYASN